MASAPHGQVCKRIWRAACLLAAFILILVLGNFFLPADKAFNTHMFGHDFLPFYTAGQFVRMGRVDQLYDPAATKKLEHQTCDSAGLVIHNEYGAFLNPPFVALPAAGLAGWPYRTALAIWAGILAVFLLGGIWMLVRIFPAGAGWRMWGLTPLLMFCSVPVWQAAVHAQNTFFSLLVLAGTVTLWRKQRPLAAGVVAGLLSFKPQLGVVIAIALIAMQGWRAFVGVSITALSLGVITLIAMPNAFSDYIHRMPLNLQAIQSLPNYMWHRHITFLAAARMMLQGHVGALASPAARLLSIFLMLIVAAGLAWAIVSFRKDALRTDRLIAATIVTMPLLMPYYMDYDITLLSVAAVLCAVDAIRFGYDRSVLLAWIALYIAMELNPTIAGGTNFIPAVLSLALLSMRLIFRALEPMAQIAAEPRVTTREQPKPLAIAA